MNGAHGAGRLEKLRVMLVAAQAAPFAPLHCRGLAQVAGQLPAALNRLGVDARLAIPWHYSTQTRLAELGVVTTPGPSFEVNIGALSGRFTVQVAVSPLKTEQPFTVYLLDNKELRGEADKFFGYSNDAERFALLSAAVLELQRQLGFDPDIIDCHDWHFAFIPSYLQVLRDAEQPPLFKYAKPFFTRTRAILTIHDLAFTGETTPVTYNRAGLGVNALPAHAEFNGRFSPLKMGFYRADKIVVSRPGIIEMAVNGAFGPDFALMVRERLQAGQLKGLLPNNTQWRPEYEFDALVADNWARAFLAVCRALIPDQFPGMREATQTEPPSVFLHPLPLERLATELPYIYTLYQGFAPGSEERALLEAEITPPNAGLKRFRNIRGASELTDILWLLKIKPAGGFEARLQNEGLQMFRDQFFAGDLDRLISHRLPLSKCAELLRAKPQLDRNEERTLLEIFSLYAETENTTLLGHTLKVFHAIKIILEAWNLDDTELAEKLKELSAQDEKKLTQRLTSRIRLLSDLLKQHFDQQDNPFRRALIIGILFHDLGKPVDHSTHPALGAELLQQIAGLSGVLSPAEIKFAQMIVKHHSCVGDIFGLREQDPENIYEIFEKFPDRKEREQLISYLYLFAIADVCATGSGRLKERTLKEGRTAHDILLHSADLAELKNRLTAAGFVGEEKGANRWKHWLSLMTTNKKDRDDELDASNKELQRYCSQLPEVRRQRRSARQKAADLKDRLGRMGNVWKISLFTRQVTDQKLKSWGLSTPAAAVRARLLIWLIDQWINNPALHNQPAPNSPDIKNFSFEFSLKDRNKFEQELQTLCRQLDQFDHAKPAESLQRISDILQLTVDKANSLAQITIPTERSVPSQ